jgi:uncharacterized membrane protein HdeD (DUF308 family)
MGLAIVALGAIAMASPFWAGEWTLAVLGLAVIGSTVFELVRTLLARDAEQTSSYLQAALMLVVGLLFFSSPALVMRGLLVLVGALLIADAASKLAAAARGGRRGRLWAVFNGLVHGGLGLLLIRYRFDLGPSMIGLVVGVWLISLGWEMIFVGRYDAAGEPPRFAPGVRLGLQDNEELQRRAEAALTREVERLPIDLAWCGAAALIFFAIHIGRMDLQWSVLGIASMAVAVLGDLMFALILALLLVLPVRLLWRWMTCALERHAWRHRLDPSTSGRDLGDRLAARWLDGRLRFDARLHTMKGSVATALSRVIQFGLPLTAVLVAINPIWGFSWFFNTENWVSGVWQKLVESRVDPWRAAMVDAVMKIEGAQAVTDAGLFEVHPDGVAGASDFSFLVLGDTGEGDASQHSLRDRFLLEGRRDDIKFLVIASDVIYPAGAMQDYELNFYLPFKGFEKPIYAIPGNHDWFGALEGFNANFLQPDAARAAMRARLEKDNLATRSYLSRADHYVAEASRLRREYRIQAGLQRGPFFELHSPEFAFIAIDTGILKALDDRQRAWFEAALERASGRFVMVLPGHPFYAGGYDQGDPGTEFKEIHELLARYHVPVVMAGDTHDFEYYRESRAGPTGQSTMHHLVNGGGGAYLSIGTALDWPVDAPVDDWAFYPSTAAVYDKLQRETPNWKRPLWWWLNAAGGWPASVELLSGAFDFNHAPFLQSFMEVRVEGSMRRVRLIVHGVHGPLHWRDLQTGGAVIPEGKGPDDPVEFMVPM